MKKLISALLFCALMVFLGCSSENDLNIENAAASGNFDQMNRGASDFSALFSTLYGSSSYKIGSIRTEIKEDAVSYYVTEIYATTSGTETLRGYLLETPSEDFFMEHIKATGTLNQYSVTGLGKYKKSIFDLTKDPLYPTIGFNPFSTGPGRVKPRRFFGTSTEWGGCGKKQNGEPGCFQGQLQTSYVFWIAGDTTASLDENGKQIQQDCDCPPGVE